ncbi:MAG: substrate-binding domain-containing protein [Candidatus Faecivicinus sp.]
MKNGDALYLQISQKLMEDIQNGIYEDKRLPTEKELMEEFYVLRITARKALNHLADAGVVVRISGKGTFVRKERSIAGRSMFPAKHKPIIALVMGGYSASFGLDIVNAAIRCAEEENVHIILKETGNDQKREAGILEDLKLSGVDGIIVQPAHGEIYSQWLINAVFDRFPIVMVDRHLPGIEAPFVGVDNERLSEIAIEHLIEQGHRNISLIALEGETTSTLKARMDGFCKAFAKYHLPVQSEQWLLRLADQAQAAGIDKNDSSAHEIYTRAIARHLMEHPEITAVYGTEYIASKAAWDAARINGRRVPQDLSIVSFDYDSSYHGLHHLTHIKQPQMAIGRTAVQMMCALIRGEKLGQQKRLLEGEWVEGSSCAPPHDRV